MLNSNAGETQAAVVKSKYFLAVVPSTCPFLFTLALKMQGGGWYENHVWFEEQSRYIDLVFKSEQNRWEWKNVCVPLGPYKSCNYLVTWVQVYLPSWHARVGDLQTSNAHSGKCSESPCIVCSGNTVSMFEHSALIAQGLFADKRLDNPGQKAKDFALEEPEVWHLDSYLDT